MCDEHKKGAEKKKRDKQTIHSVQYKGYHSFPRYAPRQKQSSDQEHQRHKKDIVEVLKNIKPYPSVCIYHRVGRAYVGFRIEAGKSGIGQGGMMGYDQNRKKRPEIIHPDIPVIRPAVPLVPIGCCLLLHEV